MDLVAKLKAHEGLLSVKQVAKQLGWDQQTVYRHVWASPAKLPHVRINNRVMFDPAILADFIAKRSV